MNNILFNLYGIIGVGCLIVVAALAVNMTRNMIELQSIGGSLFEAFTGINLNKIRRSAVIAISKI